MKKVLAAVLVLSACFSAQAGRLFDAQIDVLMEKSELCIQSKGTGEFCDDAESYQKYLFKGNARVWGEYHIKNRDIHGDNEDRVLKAMRLANQVLRSRISGEWE